MKTIYLASPFSHSDKKIEKKRYEDVTLIAALLTKRFGHAMFLPITQSYAMTKAVPSLKGDFNSWKDIDLHMVGKSDELWVVLLDGWSESIGVLAEIKEALMLHKPIKSVTYFKNDVLVEDF
jgi:hypothetical protein